MRRLLLLALGLFALLTALFLLAAAGGWADPAFVRERLTAVCDRPGGRAAAAALVVGLLAADLLLPVPSSIVMLFSGHALGAGAGTAASFAGAMLGAAAGWWVGRKGDRLVQERIDPAEAARVRVWFERWGLAAVVLSRPVPMLTEILSCLAGAARVPAARFFPAAALGTLPLCAVYAWAGERGGSEPWIAVLVAVVVPGIGWIAMRRVS